MGLLDLQKFEPFPKNPAISKVFREIGLADELGSGMRNTYKYTQLYSGQNPLFEEGDRYIQNDYSSKEDSDTKGWRRQCRLGGRSECRSRCLSHCPSRCPSGQR